MASPQTPGPEALIGGSIIRREGEFWTVVHGGAVCRLKDTRGVRLLAVLLQRPGEKVSAIDLERVEQSGCSTEGAPEQASAPDPLDPRALERARVNVTRSVRAVLQRIAAHHPGLGVHLSATIKTGAFCCYRPDPRIPIRWES